MSTDERLMSTDERLMSMDERLMAMDSWSMWPDRLLLQTDGALPQVPFHQWFRRFAVGEVVVAGSPS